MKCKVFINHYCVHVHTHMHMHVRMCERIMGPKTHTYNLELLTIRLLSGSFFSGAHL